MAGTSAYLINDVNDIKPEWLAGVGRVGITAGASTPECSSPTRWRGCVATAWPYARCTS